MSTDEDQPSLQSRRGATFLWRKVMDTLEREIRTGALKPGEQLPTEGSLATMFEVHQNTIRHAISALQEKGLVRGEKAAAASSRRTPFPRPSARTRLSATIRMMNRVESRQLLARKTVRATPEAASGKIRTGTYLRRVDFLNFVEEHPFSLSTHFFPLPRFQGIDEHIERGGSITKAFQALGVPDYRHLEITIKAVALTRKEAELLQEKRARPALLMTNTDVDGSDVPIQFTYARLSSVWVELVVRFDEL